MKTYLLIAIFTLVDSLVVHFKCVITSDMLTHSFVIDVFLCLVLFYAVYSVFSSFTIILMGKRKPVALLYLSS